jgi:hypothetical protein
MKYARKRRGKGDKALYARGLSAMRLVMACVDVCPRFHFRFRLSTLSALFFVLTRI